MNLNKSPPIFKGLLHPCLGIAAGGDLILGNRQQLIHHIDDHDDFLLTELASKARHGGKCYLLIKLINLQTWPPLAANFMPFGYERLSKLELFGMTIFIISTTMTTFF